jgi:hypothetical protein
MKVRIDARVCDKRDVVFKAHGYYYSDGRIRLVINEFDGILEIDPACYNEKNPKRLMYEGEDGYRWSKYFLRSMLLDTKPKRKPKS